MNASENQSGGGKPTLSATPVSFCETTAVTNSMQSSFSVPALSASSPLLELSIIIPAFNEEQRLPLSLKRICAYLRSRSLQAEVIVVDDGSADATARVVNVCRCEFPELRLISNGSNRGKGFSVRRGMLEASGNVALFTDADLSAPIEEVDKLLAVLHDGTYDAVIGSRRLGDGLIEIHQSVLRELAGMIFNRVVRLLIGIRFKDTQCGLKAFNRETTRVLFELQRTKGFGFDPEILFLAQQKGLRVAEIPVRWGHDFGSKVRVFGDSFRMLLDVLAIRWNALIGRYSRELRSCGAVTKLRLTLPK